MSNGYWTFGGGPAERIETRDGEFEQGVHLFVRSAVTGQLAEVEVETGPNGLIPTFHLPGTWEWSSVDVSVDDVTMYPLGQARQLQARPGTVLRLQDTIRNQQRMIAQQRAMITEQGEQIATMLTQVAAATVGSGVPAAVDPVVPELPAPVDPITGESASVLPMPGQEEGVA